MCHLMGEQKLLLEAGDNGGVGGEVAANHFERNKAVQFAILGFVHCAHAAFAQKLQNFITSAEYVSGLQHWNSATCGSGAGGSGGGEVGDGENLSIRG